MKIFIATAYSSQIDYTTGKVNEEFKIWLESEINALENLGHEVVNALRADDYKINTADPAAAFSLDVENIKKADALIAYVEYKTSTGVQTEIGYALALNKKVFITHSPNVDLKYFNRAIILSGQATEVLPPVSEHPDLQN